MKSEPREWTEGSLPLILGIVCFIGLYFNFFIDFFLR